MVDANARVSPKLTLGRAIGLMLLANLLFAVVDTSTKWLVAAGLVAIQFAFMRYAFHFAITAIDVRRAQSRAERLSPRVRLLVALRAFCLVSATVANFIALGHLSLAVTSAILFLAPVIVCLLAALLLNERITPGLWAAILLGFAGVVVIVRPLDGEVNWCAVLMLYPASGMAMYSVLTRMLVGFATPATMQFYTGTPGTVAFAPFALAAWVMPEGALNWTLLFGIGAVAWAGHEAMTRAHTLASASVLMPFGYSFVIYLNIAGWIVFADAPDGPTVAGSLMIVLSGLAIWRLQSAPSVA